MKTAKRFGAGILVGFLLATLFSAPWVYQAWAVGSCAVFRSWNTGDTVTAGDLNSSFTTAAVTNSTPQCLDDYSATVTQMQATTDPFASGAESQATSTAGELERLRFMFKQIFGLTNWYRHDQAPTFSFSHMNASALHLSSIGVAGGTDTVQNQFLSRFPVLTGPNHWTGLWWPHNTTHMAISIADYNHAQGGVQGGIELFRFHARGVIFHHTVALMFKHSESQMHGGQRGHITALSVSQIVDGATDPNGKDQLILGHAGTVLQIQGIGITGASTHHRALFIAPAGHVYSRAPANLRSMQVITATGTWTKPAGIRRVFVEVVGGGGGGGGTAATAFNAGAGGSGGGYAAKLLDVSAIATSTVTVGAGGTGGVAASAGNNGAASSWADGTNTLTGGAGLGGTNVVDTTGPDGGAGTGGDINIPGQGGGHSNANTGPGFGYGGSSQLGRGGKVAKYGGGGAGGAYGAGGAGGATGTAAATSGGDGAAGVVIIYEYE
jgi:hypothetical protein